MLRSITWLAVLLPFGLVAGCGLSLPGTGADLGAGAVGAGGDGGAGGADGAGGAGGDGDGGSLAADADRTAPTVLSTFPLAAATGSATSTLISATFSEPMAPPSLTGASFALEHGGVVTPCALTYFDSTATLRPASPLALDSVYTATITTAATDVGGNGLAAMYRWSFTTDLAPALGPAPVLLGTAGKYAVLAKAAITNVPTSVIHGDLGVSPAAATDITGLDLTKAGTKWTSPQVIGSVFAANGDAPTPANLTAAISDMESAYTDAAGRPTPTFLNLAGGALGALVLTPGLYTFTSSVSIPLDVTIAGARNDVWIFQTTGDLTVTAAMRVKLSGGAQAKNIYWQVAGAVDLGTTSHLEGIVIAKTGINLQAGSSITGRLLAQTAVTLASATITTPPP